MANEAEQAGSDHASQSNEPTPQTIDLARHLTTKIWSSPQEPGAHTTTSTDENDTDNFHINLLARGGYNDVWLVKPTPDHGEPPFVLRMATEDSLTPHQVRNEVGWLMYMSRNCPEVPVPKVYDYADGTEGDDMRLPFIAEEYIDGQSLPDLWMCYSDTDREIVARKVAELIVRMGEVRFEQIGSMTPSGALGPTVEGAKLFKGRDRFHDPKCYHVGPYDSIEQYVLAQYDKEIYYHTHADDSMLDMDLFDKVSPSEFAETLKTQKAEAATELQTNPRSQLYVLCHSDFQGRNILMKGAEIAAVIDWEFAGAYPLSELNGDDVEVAEWEGDAEEEQILHWGKRIQRELVPEIARERGWTAAEVEMMVGGGDGVIQGARVEMVPVDLETPEAEDDGGEAEAPG